MLLALTILINSLIALVFKGFQKYGVNNLQAIIVNYFVCAITASLIFQKPVINASTYEYPWFFMALFLGALFIFIFNIVALSIQNINVTLTTIFQKMSLVFPSVVGIFWFGEYLNLPKGLGIGLAILSVILINISGRNDEGKESSLRKYWYLAALTLLGSGVIEICLYLVDALEWSKNSNVEFTGSLFFFAGSFGLIYYAFKSLKEYQAFHWKDVLGGIFLGIPNFFSIYWIMCLLEQGMDGSIVFPVINVGVICVNALAGYFLFKERLSMIQFIGLLFAVVAIILLINR